MTDHTIYSYYFIANRDTFCYQQRQLSLLAAVTDGRIVSPMADRGIPAKCIKRCPWWQKKFVTVGILSAWPKFLLKPMYRVTNFECIHQISGNVRIYMKMCMSIWLWVYEYAYLSMNIWLWAYEYEYKSMSIWAYEYEYISIWAYMSISIWVWVYEYE